MRLGDGHYILDGKTPVPCDDFEAWAIWLHKNDRQVMLTRLIDGSELSTTFLGLDHAFGHGPPVLFETLRMLPGQGVELVGRYRTWAEAEVGHMAWLEASEIPPLIEPDTEEPPHG